ncbi:MAG: CPBP family intramembrane glutamic endopeptidase [Cocleimonas sp.]
MNLFQPFLTLLNTLHLESNNGDSSVKKQWDKRPAIVLMVVAVCLLMLNYLKYNTVLNASLEMMFAQLSDNPSLDLDKLKGQTFYPLLSQAWWSFLHVITFVLIPLFIIKKVLKEPLANYGLGLGYLKRDIKWYLLLVTPILFFVVLVSFREDFTSHYPFYELAHRSWADLIAWEVLYLLQFFCVEFFFRGFIIQTLRPSLGVNAIFVMIVPYLMLHFTKPWLEATGAILFGLFLGVLAFRSRSIWGGVMVHISIALSMDIASLLQTKGLPQQWMP